MASSISLRPFLPAVAFCALALSPLAAPAFAAEELPGPRPITAAERAAVEMVLDFFDQGPSAWWSHLATDAPLRALGREAALDEIAVRVGPPAGAHWRLETPGPRYSRQVAIFTITFPSGLDETLLMRIVEEAGGWRLRELDCMIDPIAPSFSSAPPATAPAPSPPPARPDAVPLLLLLTALLAASLAWRMRGSRLATLAAFTAFSSLAGLAACGGGAPESGPATTSADDERPARLAALLPLRQVLAHESGEAEALFAELTALPDPAGEGARLWRAQRWLRHGRLAEAEEILAFLPSPAQQPLGELLRARSAFLRAGDLATDTSFESARAIGPDHDGLRLEGAEARVLLGLEDQAANAFRLLARMGSRRAETYYALAQLAVLDGNPKGAEEHMRTAWSLKPLERRLLFGDPLLAHIAARPAVFPLLALDRGSEPVVPRRTAPEQPITVSPAAEMTLTGDRLSVRFGETQLSVPGGGALAPADVKTEDAGAETARRESRALSRLEAIIESAGRGSVAALLDPEVEIAAEALARSRRWHELEALTRAIDGANLAQVRPHLVKLRAVALDFLERHDQGRKLLLALARDDMVTRRRDPATLYQLADAFVAGGEYDLAIKLLEKANRLTPRYLGDQRILQIRLEQRLVADSLTERTRHFDIRYPRLTGDRYARSVGRVLEAEWKRLLRWIPLSDSARVEVHLFPLREFMRAYSGSVIVVGLYDGKLRVPFADLRSLHPELVAILSHELAHAMLAEATDDQAPKWFHEGLAQHVEMVQDALNPYPDLAESGRVLSLPVVEAILGGFSEAQFVSLAYSEAAWIVHGIEHRHGVAGIKRLIDAFAAGLSTEEAIRRAFGTSGEAFDRATVAWAVDKAPKAWPTELRRYDRELEDRIIKRAQHDAGRPADSTDRSLPHLRVSERAVDEAKVRLQQQMEAWHQRYSAGAAPVKEALGPVIQTFRSNDGGDPDQLCATLVERARTFMADDRLLATPDPAVNKALTEAYNAIFALSHACRRGASSYVRSQLVKVEQHLGEAAKLLGPYSLAP